MVIVYFGMFMSQTTNRLVANMYVSVTFYNNNQQPVDVIALEP